MIDREDLDYILANVSKVTIEEDVMDYLVNIVNETRNKDNIQLGVSPRGSIALFKASQAYAAINGRDYIIPEDIKYMAPYVLNHRIIASGINSIEDSIEFIKELVELVKFLWKKCKVKSMVWFLIGFLVFTFIINRISLNYGFVDLDYYVELNKKVYEIGEEIEVSSILENRKLLTVSLYEDKGKVFPRFSCKRKYIYYLYNALSKELRGTYKLNPVRRGHFFIKEALLELGISLDLSH